MQFHDASSTRSLLDLRCLVTVLADVLREYGRGEIRSPERLALPCGNGAGLLLSMPCQAHDLVVHKLLTVYASNPSKGVPSIQGQVTAFDAGNGVPLFCLDGPTVTSRRTAAISMIGIGRLRPKAPALVSVIGTGVQARGHVDAVLETYPEAQVRIRGASGAKEEAFCAAFRAGGRVAPHRPGPVEGDVVIAVTSSRTPVFDEAADPGRLVIGVGAYRLDMVEIGSRTIKGSQVYVDDPVGAPREAGDVAAAGTDWSTVKPLSAALDEAPDFSRPVFLKSVGCGAWDLAACRAARLRLLERDGPERA